MRNQETNIYDIASEAGVSIATVSRVINNSTAVSAKSRKKVLDAIEKLNYVPNVMARSLSTSVSTSIGVVVPDIRNPFFSTLLQGITHAADAVDMQIVLCSTDESKERECQVLQSMRELRLRGLLIAPVSEHSEETLVQLRSFAQHGIPVVLLDRELECDDFDRVVTFDEEGVYHAVSHLISLGHRRLGIITGPLDSRPGKERLNGYERALKENGMMCHEEYIREGDFRMERAYAACMELLELPQPPTAIFSSNNMTTYGCLRAFQQKGLQVGADISLIGFDDIEALNWLNYNISVVDRDVQGMGAHALRLLLDRVEQSETLRDGVRDCLPTQLLLRGSEQYIGEF